jgi:protein involved in temperature-dependent protein secretion
MCNLVGEMQGTASVVVELNGAKQMITWMEWRTEVLTGWWKPTYPDGPSRLEMECLPTAAAIDFGSEMRWSWRVECGGSCVQLFLKGSHDCCQRLFPNGS